MTFDEAQELPIDVRLLVDGNTTTFEDVDTIVIYEEVKRILTADHTPDADNSKADLTWTYTGTIDYFKVVYGTNRNVMNLSLTTSQPMGSIILAEPTSMYYAQIFPVDENGIVVGDPSEILEIGPLMEPVPIAVCGNGVLEA